MALSCPQVYKNLSGTHIVIHILCCLLGIASWVDLSGILVELPILVTTLPEGMTLFSIAITIMQVGNIGPVIFAICFCIFPRKKLEKHASFIIIIIGILACVLLTFFWDKTTYLFGEMRSTALLSLILCLALVDSTSSLAFLAFMAVLKEEYLAAYFVGDGLSTCLPALLALGQGSGQINCVNTSSHVSELQNGSWNNYTVFVQMPIYDPPRISIQIFFITLAGFLVLSLIAFFLLIFFPYCKIYTDAYCSLSGKTNETQGDKPNLELTGIGNSTEEKKMNQPSVSDTPVERKEISLLMTVVLLVQMFWLGIIFMIVLSILPYVSFPYGLRVFHLAKIIGGLFFTGGPVLYFVIPLKSPVVLGRTC